MFSETRSLVLVSCALVSKALSKGSICLDLDKIAGSLDAIDDEKTLLIEFPEMDEWISQLEQSTLVGTGTDRPLVIDRE